MDSGEELAISSCQSGSSSGRIGRSVTSVPSRSRAPAYVLLRVGPYRQVFIGFLRRLTVLPPSSTRRGIERNDAIGRYQQAD